MCFQWPGFTALLAAIRKRGICAQKLDSQEPQAADLKSLPPEILLYIGDFLPLSSLVCFALSSRRLMQLFGSQALASLKSVNQVGEKKLLFATLERDLADYLLCHHCDLFHLVSQNDGPRAIWGYHNEPACVRASGLVYISVEFKIQFHHAQLLMNNYRFGRPQTRSIESLSYNHARTIDDASITTKIRNRVVDDELIIWINSKMLLPDSSSIKLLRHRITDICPHMTGLEKRYFDPQNLFCLPCHTGRVPCRDCRKQKHCKECLTWFQASGKQVGSGGTETEIEIDIWRNLGTCQSPFDMKWLTQTF